MKVLGEALAAFYNISIFSIKTCFCRPIVKETFVANRNKLFFDSGQFEPSRNHFLNAYFIYLC